MPKPKKKPTEPPALDPGLGNVLFDVWLVSRATTALLDRALHSSGLDADEFAIYSVLISGDGMTPSELAQWMAAPATTVSSYVKRFEARGHVHRVSNPDDRRSYRLRLTAAGKRAHQAAGKLFLPVLDDVSGEVGAGLDETHHHLRQLHQVVAKLNLEAS